MSQPRTSVAAILSLIFGILAFCLGLLSGIPAIIAGVVGLGNIGKSDGMLTGRGLAIAGIVVGSVGTVLNFFVMLALLLPAVTAAREAARRTHSKNNLQQIGLAMHEYHDVYMTFPPGGVYDRSGRMHHGWQTMLLPYLEQDALYKSIDFDSPWDDPVNAPLFQQEIAVYQRPGIDETRDAAGFALSHYAGNSHVFGKNSSARISRMMDGTSNTIMAGEVAENFKPWGHPANWRDPAAGLNLGPNTFGRPTGNVVLFLMGDGAVKFLRDDVDPEVLQALSTPAGGESVKDLLPAN